MISLLITILIGCLILSLIWWIFTLIPLPAPFALVVRVIVAIIAVIWLISLLLPLAGHPGYMLH